MKKITYFLVLVFLASSIWFVKSKFYDVPAKNKKELVVQKDVIFSTKKRAINANEKAEILSKRTATSKTFALSENVYRNRIYAAPIHYLENGVWKNIDVAITKSVGNMFQYENTTNTIQSFFPEKLSATNRVSVKNNNNTYHLGSTFSFSLENNLLEGKKKSNYSIDLSNTPVALVSSNTIKYDNGNSLGYLSYDTDYNNLKQKFILKELPKEVYKASEAYFTMTETIRLSDGWNIYADGNAVTGKATTKSHLVIKNAKNELAFVIPLPEIYEEKNPNNILHPTGEMEHSYTISKLTKANEYEIKVAIPRAWLVDANRSFPVVIDPTTTLPGGWGGWHNEASTIVEANPSSFVFTGALGASTQYRSWTQFDVSSIQDGSTVNSIILEMGMNGTGNAGISETIIVNNVTGDLGPYSTYNASAFADFADGPYGSFMAAAPGTYSNINLGGTANADLESRLAGDLFQIAWVITSPSTWKRFTSNLNNITVDYSPVPSITSTVGNPTNVAIWPMTVTFPEDVTGFAEGDLIVSNGMVSDFTTSDNTVFTFNLTPTVEGDVTVDVPASSAVGNVSMNPNNAATQFIAKYDITDPLFSSSLPLDDATLVATADNITITFNEDIAFGTGNIQVIDVTDGSNSFTIDAASPGAQASVSGAVLTINPSTDLDEGTNYAVQIAPTAIDDLAGNSFAGIIDNTTLDFTTIDATNPTLISSSPADDATDIALDSNIVLTFNENIAFGTGNIQVIDVSDGSNSFTIDAASPGAQASISGAVLTINPSGNFDPNANYAVQIAPTAIDDLAGNSYDGITDNTTLDFTTVVSIPPTITFTDIGKTYGDANFNLAATSDSGGTISYSIIGAANGTSLSGTNNETVTIGNVGAVTIRATQAADGVYTSGTKDITLTIAQKTVTISAAAVDKVYDGTTSVAVNSGISGIVTGDDATVNPPFPFNFVSSDVGTNITVVGTGNYTITGSDAGNYTLIQPTGLSADITAASLTVTADSGQTKVYGATDPSLTYTITGWVNGETEASLDTPVSISRVAGEDVGMYTITPSGATDANYTINFVTANFSITAASLTVTADSGQTKVYGTTDPSLTYTITGWVNGDTEASLDTPVSISRVAGEDVGMYTITPSGATDANYTINFVTANFSITVASLTVTADSGQTKVYGTTDPSLTYTITGWVNGDTEASLDTPVSISRVAGEDVGMYTITPSGATDANYTINFVTANFSITVASLTVTADSGQTKVYGATDPSLTYTITGWVNGDTEASLDTPVSISRVAGEDVGMYTITPSGATDANYTISFVTADFSITVAALTVTADDKSRDYGANNPVFTITYSGFVNGDTAADLDTAPVASTTATVASNTGTYDIDVSGAVDANYTITHVKGTLTINTILASVVTNDATAIGGLFATYNGEVTSTGGEPNLNRGFVYSDTNTIPTLADITVASATGIGVFLENITSLQSETTYYYRSFATNSAGTSYGVVKEFRTLDITPPDIPYLSHISEYTCPSSVLKTGDNTLEISGTAEPLSIVEVFIDGTSIGTVATANSGFFTFDHTGTILADGIYNITVTATDASANTSPVSNTLTIEIDSLDSDGDGLPDFCDDDVDGNGVTDTDEDCDGDGIIDSQDTDNSACASAIAETKSYGFSPNGDAINDTWTIENITSYPNSVVQVFSRSGKLVFKKKGYQNDWAGVSNQISNSGNNSKLPVGPYIFVIDLGDGSKPTRGWLYINY
jgi:gliding motility-associated-like protein